MKRKLGLLLVITMVITMLNGCGSNTNTNANTDADASNKKEESKSNELTVWCWDKNFNIYAMNEAAKIYQKDHPDFKLNVVETAWDDVQTKLTTAVTSGQTDTLPDILLMQDNALAKNITNYPDTFVDLTNSGIDFSQFAQYKTALSTVNNKIYGVPFDSGTAVTALRTDILEKAGYTINDFKDITWSRFIEIGKDVLKKTGMPLLSSQAGSPDLVMMMLQSAGVWAFKDGKLSITDNPVLQKAVDTYVELVKSGVLIEVNNWDQYIATFNTGKVAGAMTGCWILASVQASDEQKGKWAVTNIPKLDGIDNATNYSSVGGSSWLVLSNSKNKDLAVDFLSKTFAGSTDLYNTILKTSSAIATWGPASTATNYGIAHEYFGGQKIFEDIIEYGKKVPKVSYGVYNYEARDAIGTAITKIISGTDKDSALKEAESTVKFQMGQ